MNQNIFSGTIKPVSFLYARILTFLFILVVLNAGLAEAKLLKDVAFKWRANPPGDHVIGYRLYYGGTSRFKSNGKYDYYIDFATQKRCVVTNTGTTSCKFLSSNELKCNNLYGNNPKCTVSNLHGHLYFALTAYNAQVESGYTRELKLTVNPKNLAAVQNAITTILLKDN